MDTKTDQLIDYYFLPAAQSIRMCMANHPMIEELRIGHGVLDPSQFAYELKTNTMQIVVLPNECAALVAFGEVSEGIAMNILTTRGSMKDASFAIECLEAAARWKGAAVVISVGHVGWSKLVKQHGYTVTPRILMKKVLQ